MTAITDIASAVAAVMGVGTVGGLVYRIGRRDSKIDAAIERLTDIVEDHEDRIREQEGRHRDEPLAFPRAAPSSRRRDRW